MFALVLITAAFFGVIVVYTPRPLLEFLAGYPLLGHGLVHFFAITSIGFYTDTRTTLTVCIGAIGSMTLWAYGKFVGTRRFERGKLTRRPGEWRI
jgi:hypothetical protein